MFRVTFALVAVVASFKLGADVSAREPGALGLDAFQSQPPTTLFANSATPVLVPSTLPDLHLSTPGQLTSSPTIATPSYAGPYTLGGIPLSGGHAVESTATGFDLRLDQYAGPPPLLLSTMADQPVSPSVTATVLPTSLRETSNALAVPAFNVPSAQILSTSRQFLNR